MDGSPAPTSPHTPLSRPMITTHRRLDSFPTDEIHEGSEFGVDDENSASGMPASISLGAFPVFLIQESPSRTGVSKAVPLFPESPESAFGFQSPPRTTCVHSQQPTQVDSSAFGLGGSPEDLGYFCQDQTQQTPTRAPIRKIHDQQHAGGDVYRKLSLEKAGMDFGRRLYHDDDETLVGPCDVTATKLRPEALRYSSSTSTSLASPLFDSFAPGSPSYSISTESSRHSPHCASMADCSDETEDFPTEVGGTASLDLEVPPLYAQAASSASSAATLELKPVPLRSQGDIEISSIFDNPNPFATTPHTHSCLTLEPAVDPGTSSFTSSGADRVDLGGEPEGRATDPLSKEGSYGQLGHGQSPQLHLHLPPNKAQVQHKTSTLSLPEAGARRSASSPVTSAHPLASSTSPLNPNRRRAFSGTRDLLQGLAVESKSQPLLVPTGRFRSSSVNSSTHRDGRMTSNDLIEQAARSRSRSNSASEAVPYPARGTIPHATSKTTLSSSAGSRTLNSSKSKESFRSKFANLPGYVTFLREITLELWIDQEGFRAIRPQFELHRYTPGPGPSSRARSGIRMGFKNSSPAPMSPVRSGGHIVPAPLSPPATRQLDVFPHSSSNPSQISLFSSAESSPSASRLPVHMHGSTELVVEQPLKPQLPENWGMAEFTMKKRQGWNFHHGVGDSEPVLRRLTIDGVEDRDYLSREATLCIKSHGVYTVKGTEDRGRFEWKLEYLVEDRRGPSGAVVHGEKTLTLLSFSCAPELLIPEQGRKVKLLHVMKKSITPKIHSTKLDPPMVPGTPASGSGSSTSEATATTHSHCCSGKKLENLVKIVRPSSAKSRPVTPKHDRLHAYSPPQTPVRNARQGSTTSAGRTSGEGEPDGRRAASYSNVRPDLRKVLAQQLED